MDISKSIEICLIRRGWSKTDLAEKLGVSKTTISNLCGSPICDGKRIVELSELFGMSASDFVRVGEDDE